MSRKLKKHPTGRELDHVFLTNGEGVVRAVPARYRCPVGSPPLYSWEPMEVMIFVPGRLQERIVLEDRCHSLKGEITVEIENKPWTVAVPECVLEARRYRMRYQEDHLTLSCCGHNEKPLFAGHILSWYPGRSDSFTTHGGEMAHWKRLDESWAEVEKRPNGMLSFGELSTYDDPLVLTAAKDGEEAARREPDSAWKEDRREEAFEASLQELAREQEARATA